MKLNKYEVGKRYGKALFELAETKQVLEEVFQDVQVLRQIFTEVPNLGDVLSNSKLAMTEKDQIIETLTSEFQGLLKQALFVIYRNQRMDDLLYIIADFEGRYYEKMGVLPVKVTTTVPLNKQQKEQLVTKLKTQFGYAQIELTEAIDPTILGGVVVETKNQVIDGSLKTRLNQIKKSLSK